MITVPAGVRIYLACGVTDMRRGFDGLSIMAQDVLKQDPFSGAIFCFRGRRGDRDAAPPAPAGPETGSPCAYRCDRSPATRAHLTGTQSCAPQR